mgnify:CR=1 FL=1
MEIVVVAIACTCVGAMIGLFAAALCCAAGRADDRAGNEQ